MKEYKNIALIEDDASLSILLDRFLRNNSFHVYRAKNALRGIKLVDKNLVDLYILDLGLPDKNGVEVLKYIRSKDFDIPIIVITGFNSIDTEINSFKYGATLFHKKPINFDLLIAQINTCLKKVDNRNTIEIEGLVIDSQRYLVENNGVLLELTRKEFKFLNLLLKNHSKIFTREEIVSKVLDSNKLVSNSAVDTLVSRVRRKLYTDKPDLIETVFGIGYRVNPKYQNRVLK